METPDEKKGRIKFNGNWPLTYDEADEDATFSDHEGWKNPASVPEQEVMDLIEDEQAFRKLFEDGLGQDHDYSRKQGQALQLTMRDPDDYYSWRETNNGKCYPVYQPDGSYIALRSHYDSFCFGRQ